MKKVFITGISSGIGRHAAKHLTNCGYEVHGSVRKIADKADVLQEIKRGLTVYLFDVTDRESVMRAAKEYDENTGGAPLFALINNAGTAIPGPMKYISDEEFKKQIEINVHGVRYVTNAFLPFLGFGDEQENGQKIINISSVSGLFSVPFNGPYCISKHALESMSDVYRRELLPYHIDVIVIEPGPIKSEIWKKNLGKFEQYKDTPYQDLLNKADTMIANAEKTALPTEKISTLIHKILASSKPKTRYLVHKKPVLFKLLSKWLPDRMVDKMIWKNFKKDTYRPV